MNDQAELTPFFNGQGLIGNRKQGIGQGQKVQDGQLRLVLMQGIGKAFIASDFSLEALAQSLNRMIPS